VNLLAARGLTVRFGGLTALDGVDLTVRHGEVVGVMGPNGAGKSTLFEALSGRVRLASGSILFDGHDITRWPPHRRARAGMGRTFQEGRLLEQLTARNHLDVSLAWRPDRRVDEYLDLLEVLDVPPDVPVSDLPLAARRAVNIARALALDPLILLLDEPAAGLSEQETVEFARALWVLKQAADLTLVLVEHDVDLVLGLADFVYVLDAGRVIAEGAPDDVRSDAAVIDAYLGVARA
jgi:branched-chain amino acid transport system ATP-binding protein